MAEIASTFKVAQHKEKLESYLRGEPVFPATLELDLTTACNMNCPHCASTTTVPRSTLDMDFIERLLAFLEGQTKGLLLTGGEPTMAPTFAETLRLARQRGFEEIVVVTNGTLLNERAVADALLQHGSAVRVSIYDWTTESPGGRHEVEKTIETLRCRIDREGSKLEIGVSALTTHDNAGDLETVISEMASVGAHWVYFHPFCVRWDSGAPERVDQSEVIARVAEVQRAASNGMGVFAFPDRYEDRPLSFDGYHAAHFLLVVGGDGMNYLAPETKYHPENVIADLSNGWSDDFLWTPERLARIAAVSSDTYPAMGSRHRGVLYNDLIDRLVSDGAKTSGRVPQPEDVLLFHHIL